MPCGKSVKADFDLSNRAALLDSGYIGDSAADSHLMELLHHRAEPKMPFKKPKLSAEIIKRIERWIDLGAPYDAPLSDKPAGSGGPLVVTDEDRKFWSFQPLTKPDPPIPQNLEWCRTDIDRFVMASLEDKGLTANADADGRTLKRRAWFGLVGLPPTEAVDSIRDPAAALTDEAWEQLIDELLGSPHYGERWARHWMDVVRFAESHGYEQDYDRPNAYHYRGLPD